MAHHANAEYSHEIPPDRAVNYTMMQGFEWYCPGGGKHWGNLKDRVEALSGMGITALWLPPPCKASSEGSVGYDIYDLWDLGEFEQKGRGRATKYGTREELVELVSHAQKHGIVTYLDAVLNHKFGADGTETFRVSEVEPEDRLQDHGEAYDIQGWTKFRFSERKGAHDPFEWYFNHFTGVDFDASHSNRSAIFRIHGDNKHWAWGVDNEKRNYGFLMGADIDHRHPDVLAQMLKWGKWVIDTIGAARFRFDAVKHIDYDFMKKFVASVRDESTKSKLFAVGEFWKNNTWDIDNYLNHLGTQFSVFDVPLHYRFKTASDSWNTFDMRTIFDGTLVQLRPIDAVTFVDNHDTQIGQSLQSWVQPWFKPLAYSLILLRANGYPCVFYGDLYGCGEKGKDNYQQPMSQLADFIRARKLFAHGETRDSFDHPNCIGWVRTGDKDNDGCAVLMCTGSEGTKRMKVGEEHANEKWTDLLEWHKDEVIIGSDGYAEFRCPAGSVSIWASVNARGREEFKKHQHNRG